MRLLYIRHGVRHWGQKDEQGALLPRAVPKQAQETGTNKATLRQQEENRLADENSSDGRCGEGEG